MFDGERVEIGTASPVTGGAACSTEPRYGAIVHRRIDETLFCGEAGVRLSAFTRASSGAKSPRCRSASIAAVCGSQYTAEPAPERPCMSHPLTTGALRLFYVGHVPDDRPLPAGLAMLGMLSRHRDGHSVTRPHRYGVVDIGAAAPQQFGPCFSSRVPQARELARVGMPGRGHRQEPEDA